MANKRTNLILNITQKLHSTQSAHKRALLLRSEEHKSIKQSIRKTAWYVIGAMIFVATISDILSFFDVGWVMSWLIPVFSWFMVLKINAILKQSPRILAATQRLAKEEQLIRQRLMMLLPPIERAKLGAQTYTGDTIAGAKSYVTTWIRDSIITQLIELIPIVDILPLYLGQVIKMIINQNIEYQKVQKLIPTYERGLSVVESLEGKEIAFLNRRLAALINSQPIESLPAPRSTTSTPGSIRDIGRSRPTPFRPQSKPLGQSPAPVRQPIRDIELPGVALPAAA